MRQPIVTKSKILQTASSLFNTQGYQLTSISEITDATGLTKGALYKHFGSKENLEKEAFHFLQNSVLERFSVLIKEAPTAPLKLAAIFTYFIEFAGKRGFSGGCPLLNSAIEFDDSDNSLKQEAKLFLGQIQNAIVSIVEKGKKYQQIHKHVHSEGIAVIFVASLEGAVMMSKLQNNNEPLKLVCKHLQTVINEISI